MEDDFLLRLYRLARESAAGEFQPAAIGLLKRRLDFESAFWGEGHLLPEGAGAILKSAHVDEIDPAFLASWQALNDQDRVIPVMIANPGRSLEVRTASFYAAEPEWAALGEAYRMRSFSVTNRIAANGVECEWLSLFRPDAEASGTRSDLDWLEYMMPHLCEALRIHRTIHAGSRTGPDPHPHEHLAVADRQSGTLLNAEPGFVEALTAEWQAFDGVRTPSPIRRLWLAADRFAHDGRAVRVSGACAGDLVMLSVRSVPATHPMTRRQREIAEFYSQGWSHKEIAARVGVSPSTVRNHVASIYQSLGVHSRRELAAALEDSTNRPMTDTARLSEDRDPTRSARTPP